MSYKKSAVSFLKLAAFGNVQEAYEKFISPDFIHHNQYFKGDRQSLMDAMAAADKTSPNKSFEIKHIYEDGNTVITHSLVQKEDMEIAVVHIFRFEGEKVVELWDVGQIIDTNSPNENGLF
jgi:predicted SnoaL-like aldol condensation-catalyzing enzyme